MIKSKRSTSKAHGEYFSITDTNPLTASPTDPPLGKGVCWGICPKCVRVCVCGWWEGGLMRADAGGFVPDSAAPAMHFLLIMSPAHHCLQQSNAYLQITVSIVFIERLFIFN